MEKTFPKINDSLDGLDYVCTERSSLYFFLRVGYLKLNLVESSTSRSWYRTRLVVRPGVLPKNSNFDWEGSGFLTRGRLLY